MSFLDPGHIWSDVVGAIKSIPSGAEHDLKAVVDAAKDSPEALGHIVNFIKGMGQSMGATGLTGIVERNAANNASPAATGSSSLVPGGAAVSKSTTPSTSLFNLQAAMQPYVQPYENMMDTLLGSKPGVAPTVAQAEKAGMSQLAPYLQGLPAGLAQTISKAAQPEFAAAAGLPAAVNASVQTEPYAGLLTDLISAARNQMIYGAGIQGLPQAPGAVGDIQSLVSQAGTGLSGLAGSLGLTTPATTSTSAPSTSSVPGG